MTEQKTRIHIDFPHPEDFEGAVAVVRATGAVHAEYRHFVIDGPMTTTEVAALFELTRWVDGGTDDCAFTLRFDPEYEADDVLRSDVHEWWASGWSNDAAKPKYRRLPGRDNAP